MLCLLLLSTEAIAIARLLIATLCKDLYLFVYYVAFILKLQNLHFCLLSYMRSCHSILYDSSISSYSFIVILCYQPYKNTVQQYKTSCLPNYSHLKYVRT